jgi:hypothetical protein
LDFDNITNNFSVIPLKIPGYKEHENSRSKFTKVTTIFPCTDARDFYEGRYEAKIIHGGKAIQVTVPTVPSFWLKYLNKINKRKIDNKQGNLQDKEAHEMMITRMMETTQDIRTMNVVFECPGDILVSNKLYNAGAADQYMLVPRIEGCGSSFGKITQTHFFVFFDMVVVGSEENIRRKRDDADADLTDMFAGMDFDENDYHHDDDDDNDEGFAEEY